MVVSCRLEAMIGRPLRDIELADLYACFPFAVQTQARAQSLSGAGRIEAYTVLHARHDEPTHAVAACVLDDKTRAWARLGAPDDVYEMLSVDPIGRSVRFTAAGARLADDSPRYVGMGRFELPTPCSQSRCAARLRYIPWPHHATREA